MQTYKIIVHTGLEIDDRSSFIVSCNCNVDILTATRFLGISAPYSCRMGTCSTCVALLKKGSFVQHDQSFLSEDQIKAGYILTCVATPTSDSVIILNKEMDLY
uniref:Ferredoxin n=1 Tax=Callithamnion tetricum TaxID=193179 RepID=A0A4D6WNF7_9FLOR|nr:ferredoxin [Callithamnion tetricum]